MGNRGSKGSKKDHKKDHHKKIEKKNPQPTQSSLLPLRIASLPELQKQDADVQQPVTLSLDSQKLTSDDFLEVCNSEAAKRITELYLQGNEIKSLRDENTEQREDSSGDDNGGGASGGGGAALLSNLELIHLQDNKLDSAGLENAGIGAWTAVEWVSLGANEGISELPADVARWTSLKTLSIEDLPNLTSLPPMGVAGWSKTLRVLMASGSGLASLCDEFSQCTTLAQVQLNGTGLRSVPMLNSWCNVEKLFVNDAQLEELPDDISGMEKLKKFNVNGNRLRTLPSKWPADIEEIYAKDNQIESLSEGISGCRDLNKLYLDRNRLTSLPDALCELRRLELLYLTGNDLESLPADVGSLRSLKFLHVHSNPRLKALPESLTQLSDTLREVAFSKDGKADVPTLVADGVIVSAGSGGDSNGKHESSDNVSEQEGASSADHDDQSGSSSS
jgi:Leucine-rich repeat (LRR) protein